MRLPSPARSTRPGSTPGAAWCPPAPRPSADVTLVPFVGGIDVDGTVTAPWVGICRRCAEPVSGELAIRVRERFADAPLAGTDEELYPIVADELDLGLLVRDAVVLELPDGAPVPARLRRACARAAGRTCNEGACGCVAPRDPRWANLDVLR